jgi:hypothetical protein
MEPGSPISPLFVHSKISRGLVRHRLPPPLIPPFFATGDFLPNASNHANVRLNTTFTDKGCKLTKTRISITLYDVKLGVMVNKKRFHP